MEEYMKKVFNVKGIDCANCAAKMENALSKIDGADRVRLNFMTERLTIEAAEDKFDAVVAEALALASKLEPDWKITAR